MINTKDLLAGGLLFGLGVFFGSYSYLTLGMGTPVRMGSGYFPLLLSAVLAVLGLAVAARSVGTAPSPLGRVSWRSVLLVILAPILFGATVRGLGFIAATAISVGACVCASRRISLVSGLVITAALTAFCYVVFIVGLRIPIRPFGPWLFG